MKLKKSLRLCRIKLRLGGCNKRTQTEDSQMNDSKILAQGKYPWGFIKNR